MTLRSLLVLVPALALVGLSACATETAPDHNLETTQQALCNRADPTACQGGDGLGEVSQGEVTSFSCPCGTVAPGGGFYSIVNGQCKILSKACCPNPKTGATVNCPPGYMISVYNPCRFNATAPYQRCNQYGQCWCSAYP